VQIIAKTIAGRHVGLTSFILMVYILLSSSQIFFFNCSICYDGNPIPLGFVRFPFVFFLVLLTAKSAMRQNKGSGTVRGFLGFQNFGKFANV
jgi:hypothetical protein